MRKESNALLQKMHPEDFEETTIYHILKEDKVLAKQICTFLSVTGIDELEFVINPDSGQYTPYDQEDFEEVLAYITCCGKKITDISREKSSDFDYRLALFESGVGRFIVYYERHLVVGILS